MSSRRRHTSSPAAGPLDDDDLLCEILLRLPPQPSSLPRASAVCKRWHSLACDPGFCHRFRRHHRGNPPLLGFFDPEEFLTFVPTLDAPNRVLPSRLSLYDDRYLSRGSRHGLVFIFDDKYRHVLVWDPVTGDLDRLVIPPEIEENTILSGAVLRDAGDVRFRVVLVVGDTEDIQHKRAIARVYSAETKLWGDLISVPLPPEASMMTLFPMVIMDSPAVLVGDSLYWQLCGRFSEILGGLFSTILEFNLERQSLDVIRVPVDINSDNFSVIREEGGGLGFLSISDFTAQLWKRKIDRDGVASWVLERTIELDKLLSLDPDEHGHILVLGYAEENNYVFLSTIIGLFMVHLQSLQFTFLKHTETTNIDSCHPFESVFTAGLHLDGEQRAGAAILLQMARDGMNPSHPTGAMAIEGANEEEDQTGDAEDGDDRES